MIHTIEYSSGDYSEDSRIGLLVNKRRGLMVYTKEFKSKYEIGDMVVYVSAMRGKVGVIKDIHYDDEEYNCFVYDIVYKVTNNKEEEIDEEIIEFDIGNKVDDNLLSAYWRGEYLKDQNSNNE